MITDKVNNQIPSATRGRMQLVKPQQTMNSGSTQNITSEKYNPIVAKDASATNSGSQIRTATTPESTQDYQNLDFVNTNNAFPDTKVGRAMAYINDLTDNEIYEVLQNIANGKVGKKSETTPTNYGSMQDAYAQGPLANQNGGVSGSSGAIGSPLREYQYNNGSKVTANNGTNIIR